MVSTFHLRFYNSIAIIHKIAYAVRSSNHGTVKNVGVGAILVERPTAVTHFWVWGAGTGGRDGETIRKNN